MRVIAEQTGDTWLSRFQFPGSDRKAPDAPAGCRKDRITDSGCDGGNPGLSDAARLFIALRNMHLDFRHFVQTKHFIIVEITLLDLSVPECNFTMKGGRQTEDDP